LIYLPVEAQNLGCDSDCDNLVDLGLGHELTVTYHKRIYDPGEGTPGK